MVNSEDYRVKPFPTRCEAIGCDAKVQYRMILMLDEGSSISFFLCKDCGPKIRDVDNSMKINNVAGISSDSAITFNRMEMIDYSRDGGNKGKKNTLVIGNNDCITNF